MQFDPVLVLEEEAGVICFLGIAPGSLDGRLGPLLWFVLFEQLPDVFAVDLDGRQLDSDRVFELFQQPLDFCVNVQSSTRQNSSIIAEEIDVVRALHRVGLTRAG